MYGEVGWCLNQYLTNSVFKKAIVNSWESIFLLMSVNVDEVGPLFPGRTYSHRIQLRVPHLLPEGGRHRDCQAGLYSPHDVSASVIGLEQLTSLN